MIDYTTLTIVLVIMISFCMPFIYSHQKKKKQEKQMLDSFLAKAQSHQLNIVTHELWRRNYVIGLDSLNAKLLYIKFHPEMKEKMIDLHKVKKVKVTEEQREIGVDKEKVVEKLWLSFSYMDPKLQEIHLEFYNAEETLGLMGEPLVIKRWEKSIQETLDSLPKTIFVAPKNKVIKA